MKLVVVDPRCSVEASKGYRWIPIRPGTELAFALAMIHAILYELNKYDVWFVKNRTNGPYLVGPDGNYLRDKITRKPMIWDKSEDRAKTFDDESIQDYALEGTYLADGVTAHPAFHLIKERMKEYTPEWAEKITSVPADTIRTVTKEFVEHSMIGSTIVIDDFEFPLRPAQFAGSGRGTVSHKGGMFFDLAGKIINMLVGAVEVPGGITGNRNPYPNSETLRPDRDGIVTAIMESVGVPFKFPPEHLDASEFYPNKHTGPHLAARALLNPKEYHLDYEVDTFMICGANPIRSVCDRDTFVEAFRKIPFIFTISPVFDETTMMSDIVLPEPFFLEREMARFYLVTHQTIADDVRGLTLVLGRKPVKQLHDTRLCDEILTDVAERAGFLYGQHGLNDLINRSFGLKGKHELDLHKKYRIREIIDRRIKTIFGDEYGFEYLMEHGQIQKCSTPGKLGYNYYYWPGNKTRHPLYFEHLKATGDKLKTNLQDHRVDIPGWKDTSNFFAFYQPIPYWIPNAEFDAPSEYDLWAINWKTHLMPFGTGDTQENSWLHELAENDPYEMTIHINRATAEQKKIKDNDVICVESRYGKVSGRAKLTELIHPEVVGIPACYGSGTLLMNPVAKEGTNFNRLLTMKEDVGVDPLSGSIDIGPRVKVYKT
jgi:anaerobic selenocysteine-containing dehydrogenase